MKVLIVGGGGREHAIATGVAKSPRVDKLYCAPGNAGIAALAECVPIGAMEFDKIVAFAREKAIDLVIVPGIAFTPAGQRLGRGRGYYDRLLPRLRNAYKMGVCWPCQMVTAIPTEPHDMPMDCVITG